MNKPTPLVADALAQDPRVAQARKLLLEAVQSHQQTLTGVRPTDPARRISYQELLKSFAECRGVPLWFPYLGSGIGHRCFVELLDGSVKYDFITGIGPNYLGHSHLRLISSSIDAALSDTIMQGNLQQNGDSAELALALAKAAQMDHCFLSSSGAIANENALKIAFQKRFPASRVLAFNHCFAGRTLTLSQITDKPSFREGLPLTVNVDYIPFFDERRPEESTKQALAVLKQHLSHHPKEYAVMFMELIQGENGFYSGSQAYFKALISLLKEHDITIIADEVQTFGRTSALFAFQHFGLQEFVDIATVGKLSQACATLFNKDHCPRPGLLSQTFTSSTSAIRASLVMLQELMQGGYFGPQGKNMQIHQQFKEKLEMLAHKYPGKVSGPYGVGSMVAFTPFDGNAERVKQFVYDLFDAGVISFVAGAQPTRVRFLVPVGAVTPQDIHAVMDIIEQVLQ